MRTGGTKPVPKYVVVRTTCDNCGDSEEGEPEGWIHVEYWHNDWDNDSIESQEEVDACSITCLIPLLARIAEEYEPKFKPTLGVNVGWLDYDGALALGRLVEPTDLRLEGET